MKSNLFRLLICIVFIGATAPKVFALDEDLNFDINEKGGFTLDESWKIFLEKVKDVSLTEAVYAAVDELDVQKTVSNTFKSGLESVIGNVTTSILVSPITSYIFGFFSDDADSGPSADTILILQALEQVQNNILYTIGEVFQIETFANINAFRDQVEDWYAYSDETRLNRTFNLSLMIEGATEIRSRIEQVSDLPGTELRDPYLLFHSYLAIASTELNLKAEDIRLAHVQRENMGEEISPVTRISELKTAIEAKINQYLDHFDTLSANDGWRIASDSRIEEVTETGRMPGTLAYKCMFKNNYGIWHYDGNDSDRTSGAIQKLCEKYGGGTVIIPYFRQYEFNGESYHYFFWCAGNSNMSNPMSEKRCFMTNGELSVPATHLLSKQVFYIYGGTNYPYVESNFDGSLPFVTFDYFEKQQKDFAYYEFLQKHYAPGRAILAAWLHMAELDVALPQYQADDDLETLGCNEQSWYRYYNGVEHSYFTTNVPSIYGYVNEGRVGAICQNRTPDTVPLYRYYNGIDHSYTTTYLGEEFWGYHFESRDGFVFDSEDDLKAEPSLVPFHRYYNGTDHFYTDIYSEEGFFGYGYETLAFYLLP